MWIDCIWEQIESLWVTDWTSNCFVAPPGPCESTPCQNGGTCSSGDNGGYKCDCLEGQTGVNCETREFWMCYFEEREYRVSLAECEAGKLLKVWMWLLHKMYWNFDLDSVQQSLIRARANHVRTEALALRATTVMSASACPTGLEKTVVVSVLSLIGVILLSE